MELRSWLRAAVPDAVRGTTALTVAFLAGIALLGWALDARGLESLIPGRAPMDALSAVTFVAASAALYLSRPRQRDARAGSKIRQGLARVLAAFVVLVGSSRTLGALISLNSGRHETIIATRLGEIAYRMPQETGFVLLLLGLALLLLDTPAHSGRSPASWFALAAGTLVLIALVNFADDVPSIFSIPLSSSILLGFLTLGILFARPTRGIMPVLLSPFNGGTLARRVLPVAIFVVLVLGWVRLLGQRAGLYGWEVGTEISISSTIMVLVVAVYWTARRLDQVDMDRERTLARLGESEERFRKVFEDAPSGMALLDQTLKLQRVNTCLCQLLEYDESELIRLSLGDFIHPGETTALLKSAHAVFEKSAPPYRGEHRLVTRCGTVVWVTLAVSVIRNAEGVPLYGLAVGEDITPLKRAEAALRDQRDQFQELSGKLKSANEELEAFAYTVSHDLKAHARAVDQLGELILLDHERDLDPEGRAILNQLRAEGQRMEQLIDDILKLSVAARGEIHIERVNLSAMAREIVGELRRGAPDRVVDVSIEEGLEADGDARLLRIVLENLLNNAWKYTSKSPVPRIVFAQGVVAGERVFHVRDNGAGFDPQQAGSLFRPFRRLHGKEFEGTGIGLATVERIIARHGGRAWAQSPGIGKGATIFFTLGNNATSGLE